jgi:hypothetical protein
MPSQIHSNSLHFCTIISNIDFFFRYIGTQQTNYGWPYCEGMCDNTNFPQCDCDLHTNPIYTYAHQVGNSVTGACIIGGTVLRNSNWPAA